MNETCDRCGPAVCAAYRVARIGMTYRVDRSGMAYRVYRNGELYLCRYCTNLLRPALSAQGWNIRLIREQLAAVSATLRGAPQVLFGPLGQLSSAATARPKHR